MIKKFATAINCMDGRAQKPVAEYTQKSFGEVSVEKHNSQIIAVVAHYDCAGNPESEDVQKEYLLKAIKGVVACCSYLT